MDAREIVQRYRGNPILTADDVPYPVATVHNAGVVRHDDGRYIMLFRSHRRNGRSIIGLAESGDGYAFEVQKKPFLVPATHGVFAEYEEYGVEDPRICALEGAFWITYSVYSRHGVRVALARTWDFRSVERVALITDCDTRNVVLFPQKLNDRYVRLTRPHTEIDPWSIWVSYSPDLVHWGDSRVVMKPARYHWDEMKIGPGATPIQTQQGWLHLFHGAFETMAGAVYRLGAALHDLSDPARVVGVSDDWILEPRDPWERNGYVPNVVFTCGAVSEDDGSVKIYWGGADTVMCVGTAKLDDLIDLCTTRGRPPL
jgi:predicted GH43/DUF377 family glycosyl hydrolase